MANLFCVKDKVVIITGGAGILGRGIAGHLAEEGAKIVILDRAAEVGEQIVADIKAKGGEASFFLTDVLNKEILEHRWLPTPRHRHAPLRETPDSKSAKSRTVRTSALSPTAIMPL